MWKSVFCITILPLFCYSSSERLQICKMQFVIESLLVRSAEAAVLKNSAYAKVLQRIQINTCKTISGKAGCRTCKRLVLKLKLHIRHVSNISRQLGCRLAVCGSKFLSLPCDAHFNLTFFVLCLQRGEIINCSVVKKKFRTASYMMCHEDFILLSPERKYGQNN